jgi:hypothetical protein
VLTQEARQRSGRDAFEQSTRTLVAQRAGAGKIWEGGLPASRFCAVAGIARKQPKAKATAAKKSARLNIHSLLRQPRSDGGLPLPSASRSPLADYAANGSTEISQVCERVIRHFVS